MRTFVLGTSIVLLSTSNAWAQNGAAEAPHPRAPLRSSAVDYHRISGAISGIEAGRDAGAKQPSADTQGQPVSERNTTGIRPSRSGEISGAMPRDADLDGKAAIAEGLPKVPRPNPDAWRIVRHNGRWWYWSRNNRWLQWNDGQWAAYPSASAHSAGYRGVPTDSRPQGDISVAR